MQEKVFFPPYFLDVTYLGVSSFILHVLHFLVRIKKHN